MDKDKETNGGVGARAERFREDVARIVDEVSKVVVGQSGIVQGVITCLLTQGHALLEGVPGLGKTVLVRTMARVLDLEFKRIQFTPDLMPADVLGTNVIVEDEAGRKGFEFQKGPIFANIVLADEINRATPKTQSAMLQAMQEQAVTMANRTWPIDPPFVVLATQNPLEMEGTYPLPEAQLDRFMLKLDVSFPDREALHTILERTTGVGEPEVRKVVGRERLLEMGELVKEVPVSRTVRDYAIRILQATHPDQPGAVPMTRRYVRYGASPRGAQAILKAAKVLAIMDGRFAVSRQDVAAAAPMALRHRIILNFEGEAEGVRTDAIIEEIVSTVPEEA